MPKKLPPIYEMSLDHPSVELSFAYYTDSKYSADNEFVEQIQNFKKHQSLVGKWKPVSVLRENSANGDFAAVDGIRYCVSEKAKKTLQREYGEHLEFLPLKVVGELIEVDDEEVIKPLKKKEVFYFLNPLAKMTIGKKSDVEKFPACLKYYSCELDEEQVKATPIFRLPKAIPIMLAEGFKNFVESKKLKGVRFDEFNKLDWRAMPNAVGKPVTKRGTAKKKSKPSKAARENATEKKQLAQFPPPKSLDVLVGGPHKRMTKKLWNAILDSCNWCCDVAKDREEDKPDRPKVAKPISKLQLEKLRKRVGHRLPAEFEHVLVNFSRKFDFYWSMFDAASEMYDGSGERLTPLSPPKELSQSLTGGGDGLWDVGLIPEFVDDANKSSDFAKWVAFEDGRFGMLPFLSVGCGDLIGFDMRNGDKDCPIVYLCHDDGDLHGRKIGDNFVDFIANWVAVGCVGPDFAYFEPFWNKRQKKILGSGRAANRWRKFMETGK